MATGLKRLNRQAEKDLKTGRISALVTNMPDGLREHFGDKYRLIFQYYDHNRCEMIRLSKDDMKRVINTFTKITKHDQTNISKLCRPDPIKRQKKGPYADLFNGLPPDFDVLQEIDYTGSGRIFAHMNGNMCCIVAVATIHK